MRLPRDMIVLILLLALDYRNQTTIAISMARLRSVCRLWKEILDGNHYILDQITRCIGWKIEAPSFYHLDPIIYFTNTLKPMPALPPEVFIEDGLIKIRRTNRVYFLTSSLKYMRYAFIPSLDGYLIAFQYLKVPGYTELIYPDDSRLVLQAADAYPTPRGLLYFSESRKCYLHRDLLSGEILSLSSLSAFYLGKLRIFGEFIIALDSIIFSLSGECLWKTNAQLRPLSENFICLDEKVIHDILTGTPLMTVEKAEGNYRIAGITRGETGYRVHLSSPPKIPKRFSISLSLKGFYEKLLCDIKI